MRSATISTTWNLRQNKRLFGIRTATFRCSSWVNCFTISSQLGFPLPTNKAAKAIFFLDIRRIGGSWATESQIGYIWWLTLELTKVTPSVDKIKSMQISSSCSAICKSSTGISETSSRQRLIFYLIMLKLFLCTISLSSSANFNTHVWLSDAGRSFAVRSLRFSLMLCRLLNADGSRLGFGIIVFKSFSKSTWQASEFLWWLVKARIRNCAFLDPTLQLGY